MKIIIPGGSGQVGQILCRSFARDGHDVVVLSCSTSRQWTNTPWRIVPWNARSLGAWVNDIDGADVVINLAGRNVNCRYNAANRREIMDSRIESTHIVGEAIAGASKPPRIWLQASTATIYAHRYDSPNSEFNGIIGGTEADVPDTWRFSIDVATSWEQAANEIVTLNTRKVLMRSAITLSPDPDGIFDVLAGLARKGLGGRSGNGRQYISWIHEVDFVRAVHWLIDHDELDGPVNLASPNPLPNAQFMRDLRRAMNIRIGLPATKWMLELGAMLMRTETELILKSRRVIPTRLLQSGFEFEFPNWREAAAELFRRWHKKTPGGAGG